MKLFPFIILLLIFSFKGNAQESPQQALDSVVITSSRIDLPFKENSRTITIITSADIKNSATTNVADLLQQVAGIDVRRRGADGTQADLYIRGGSFDQTLLLIDGMKLEDAQTGHHTLNMALPLEVIERIEVIKGPAARVFGQNAFTGAINIVTKKQTDDMVAVGVQAGSYGQKNADITVGSNLENSSHIIHVSRNLSDGYRYNTDYDNQSYFVKSVFNKNKLPITFTGNYQERKFGANGFYATPADIDQYEETQTSLVGFSTEIQTEKFTWKPRLYWRRNQDMYVFIRDNPSVYRNLHQTNKIAAEVNASYKSALGITGFGVDLSQTYIASNNLGNHNRFATNLFLEHRFTFLNDALSITPGIAVSYFSDFKFHAFPGVDIGYQVSDNFQLYGNIGYTYRVPTYTDLYYTSPSELGDENLDPEEAISEEFGVKFNHNGLRISAAFFNRDSKNLIDFVKENDSDPWQATNLFELNTKGFEVNTNYAFFMANFTQNIGVNYTFIEDDLKDVSSNFSRYSINSLKHQFVATFRSQFFKNLSQSIVYRYAERTIGDSYNVYDASINYEFNAFQFSVTANNIFQADYTETNLVPAVKGLVLFGLTYTFN
ncbi:MULTISPECIES: TonB-dependent receptor plug domain-containing protein [Bizionia]|uniref:TonB-dependent receptor n=1 Tax=Bizionia algoritergicola TaxID=291187 RepID=A0A5D0R096_9FLAO|nr:MULTISPECIES: TonB-dependent receptor [Bizionia]OBX23528.1 TonB-dependent receptor [Bizionia sp. APA-3]TYB74940.1 TonB-dependent receptor [Bizionia algoritergicola]